MSASQKLVCDAAMGGSNPTETVINNTIIFSHSTDTSFHYLWTDDFLIDNSESKKHISMGNLTLAGALMNGHCSFGNL